ncbi:MULTISPECIES: DUF4239 domain-containing protein [Legionella]|uniref:DUF4239 domain-containing protein n=1 Tax=Legionella donaldsonii TaxID=45060 RepID=A0A378J9U3_9GAMM|nr:DUF4239 domain-containing protein [Legionella donaldsonii]STX44239.1 Uncharacterised protein [Legionella donaldsonii]
MLRSIVEHVHPSLIFLSWVCIFAATSSLFFYLKARFYKEEENQDIVRLVVTLITNFYSIFLGFIVFILWTDYTNARAVVIDETTKLYIIWKSSMDFPPATTQIIQNNLSHYLSTVINQEWPAMAQGHDSPQAEKTVSQLYRSLLNYRPQTAISQSFYDKTVSALNEAIEYRNHRLSMLDISIPTAWYVMIVIGAFFIIIMSIFLCTTCKIHYFMHTLLCLFLGFYLTATTVLKYPFSGFLTVSNQPFVKLLHSIQGYSIKTAALAVKPG